MSRSDVQRIIAWCSAAMIAAGWWLLHRHSEQMANDPGSQAFAQAYRFVAKDQLVEAAEAFACAADDPQADPERRAIAAYNHGTVLLQQATIPALTEAVQALIRARDLAPEYRPLLRGDIAYQLEWAKQQLVQAQSRARPDPGSDTGDSQGKSPSYADQPSKSANSSSSMTASSKDNNDSVNPDRAKSRPGAGNLDPTAYGATLGPIPATQARQRLAELQRRIVAPPANAGELLGPEYPHVPNW